MKQMSLPRSIHKTLNPNDSGFGFLSNTLVRLISIE